MARHCFAIYFKQETADVAATLNNVRLKRFTAGGESSSRIHLGRQSQPGSTFIDSLHIIHGKAIVFYTVAHVKKFKHKKQSFKGEEESRFSEQLPITTWDMDETMS